MTTRRPSHRVAGVVLFVVAGLLLTSVGGLGIVAAPVTLPLLLLVVRRHPSRAFRIAGAVIGGLTAAELTWALVYFVVREVPVAIWLLPGVCALGTAFVFLHPSSSAAAGAGKAPSPGKT